MVGNMFYGVFNFLFFKSIQETELLAFLESLLKDYLLIKGQETTFSV